jgi:hypothetical protein
MANPREVVFQDRECLLSGWARQSGIFAFKAMKKGRCQLLLINEAADTGPLEVRPVRLRREGAKPLRRDFRLI